MANQIEEQMNENILKCFDTFQITDLDDDMIGICKSFVDFMKEIRRQIPNEEFPENETPDNFYKLQPHQPKMELRKNYRKMLAYSVKHQEEIEETTKLLNLYVTLLVGTYLYHMPTEKMIEESKELDNDFTREASEKMLLDDDMSSNWIKEPSGKDFTAIML